MDCEGTDVLTKLPRPPLVEERLLAVVDGEWRTAREIYAIFDEGTWDHARRKLKQLASTGAIECSYDPKTPGEIARYRRISAAAERP